MKPKPANFRCIYLLAFVGLLFLSGLRANADTEIRFVQDYISFTKIAKLPLRQMPKREAWRQAAPGVVEISIPRTGGEPDQPALWYHSGTPKKKPLLLVLHSWSADYLQYTGIPYAVFAKENDWIFIHPDFRGRFNNADATGSEKAVQDVLDALDYAMANSPVDTGRIYLDGFSGGAMMSLIMVGRYPEKFTAATVWVPVFDLNDWYASLLQFRQSYAVQYRSDIEASCGGKPTADAKARMACSLRSPSRYLANARGKGVKVFISGGIQDPFVPPSHAIRAFNDLAGQNQQISEADYRFIDKSETLPQKLSGKGESNRFFQEAGLPVVLRRTANNATLILFDGGHDVVYNAGLDWLAKQRR